MESCEGKCDNGNSVVEQEVGNNENEIKLQNLATDNHEIGKSDPRADFESGGKDVKDGTTCTDPQTASAQEHLQSSLRLSDLLLEEVQTEVTKLNISGEDKTPKAAPKESNVILNKTTDSLKSLMTYEDSESDSEEETFSSEDDEDDSSSDSSDVVFSESDDSESDSEDVNVNRKEVEPPQPNNKLNGAKDILGIEGELPPIPDLSNLTISDTEEFMEIGVIDSDICELVMVQSLTNKPALDIDSMLFIKDGETFKPMGPIMDVIGNVMQPMYCVRLNNVEEVQKMGLKIGVLVYAAHKNEHFTKFVFVQQLMKIKGTDASWLNDSEAPIEIIDFSDDEQECAAKKMKYQKRKAEDTGSEERYKRFEHAMNRKNTVMTQLLPPRAPIASQHGNSLECGPVFMGNSALNIPPFNPAVPPPIISGGGEGANGQSLFNRVREMFQLRIINRQSPDQNYINCREPGPSSRPY